MKSSACANYRSKNAFSLIELSIVILIIGILVAGVTSSSRLIKRMKITVAQNLTQSSPVPSIKDLAVWYESSLDKSFVDSEESDQTPITTWFDNNIQSSFKYDFKQPTVANQPKFSEGIINGLPAVKFDGTDDFMIANSVGINGKGFSAFVVGQRLAYPGTWQTYLTGLAPSQTDDCSTGSFIMFAEWSSAFGSCYSGNQWTYSNIAHPGNGTPYIYDLVVSPTNNSVFFNGANVTSTNSTFTYGFDSLRIGCRFSNGNGNFLNGYISEIIIYARALNTEERKSVESYLSKKYSIKIV
jgi:prepilin-type N-terminal cleavage/methylation domain-containing protein